MRSRRGLGACLIYELEIGRDEEEADWIGLWVVFWREYSGFSVTKAKAFFDFSLAKRIPVLSLNDGGLDRIGWGATVVSTNTRPFTMSRSTFILLMSISLYCSGVPEEISSSCTKSIVSGGVSLFFFFFFFKAHSSSCSYLASGRK